jgi:hypothetical protein
MAISSILVTSDNYWVGGRETFLVANLSLLKQRQATRISLLADSIAGAIPRDLFDETVSLSAPHEPGIKTWLNEGARLITQTRPDMIWAQHYRVLPAWLLSQAHGIPLHVTFHGPLLSAGRVGTEQEALGVTLAIHRGGILTAVSQEIADELLLLGAASERIRLMPNKVFVPPKRQGDASRHSHRLPLKLAMLAREQKLGHIRAAVQLLHAIRKRGHRAELTIYSGLKLSAEDVPTRTNGKLLDAAKRLGRKWLLRNPGSIPDLPHIEFRPPTPDSEKAIAEADVVLGMGRVVLEGLAANKPTVLIGYDHVIGLVTRECFSEYQHSNFSGRGLESQALDRVADQAVKAHESENGADREIAKLVDINESWEITLETHEVASNMNCDAQLMAAVSRQADDLLNGAIDEKKFLDNIYKTLSSEETKTYKALLLPGT